MKPSIYTPVLFPGEHINGFVARTIMLNPARDKYSVQAALSAENRALLAAPVYQTFMPALVASLSEHFEVPVDSIYRKHSMFGFYRHQMDCGILTQMLRNKVRKDIYPAGAMSFNVSTWRYCPACIEADRDKYGTDYWHVEHQLPTSLTCHLHEHVLLQSAKGNFANGNNDLRKVPQPSLNRPSVIQQPPEELQLNAAQKWLQEAGLELFNDTSKFVDSQYKYALTYEVPFRFTCLYKITPSNNIFVCDEAHRYFMSWLREHQLDVFFSDDVNIDELKTLRIDKLKYRPLSAPIAFHLLWLCFLGAKSVGDAYRDVSSADIA